MSKYPEKQMKLLIRGHVIINSEVMKFLNMNRRDFTNITGFGNKGALELVRNFSRNNYFVWSSQKIVEVRMD